MSKFHNLQLNEARDWKGNWADERLLYQALQVEPKYLDKTVTQLYGCNPDTELIKFYNSFPTLTVPGENDMYYYDVQGKTTIAGILADVRRANGESLALGTLVTPITSDEIFFLRFEKPIFSQTMTIKNESDNFQFYIENSQNVPGGTEYEVKVIKRPGDYFQITLDELKLKSRWSPIGGSVADHFSSRGMEGAFFPGTYKMGFRINKMRYEYKISGAMIEQGKNYPVKVPFYFMDHNQGKLGMAPAYVNAMEMASMATFELLKARASLYSKANWDVNGKVDILDVNGYNVPTTYGLFEQIVAYNRLKYSTFSLDYLTDVILTRMIHKRSRGDRKVRLVTGEWGAKAFHDTVDKKVGTTNVNLLNTQYIQNASASNTGATNALGFGYQYTYYRSVNGIDFEIYVADWLDDKNFFPTVDPRGGFGTAKSYTYYIMSGEMGSETGIFKVKSNTSTLPAHAMISGIRSGMNPGGIGRVANAASAMDGYEVHHMDTVGLLMKDPEAMVELSLAI